MKSYKQYLIESDKKYGFRVKLALEEVSDEIMELIKRSAAKWNLEAISEPKRLPVAEDHTGFGHLRNVGINVIDMVMDYPCTPQEVQAAIHEMTAIPMSHILVLTPQQEVLAAPIVPESDEPVLTSQYPEDKAVLLADLANALKMRNIDMPFAVKPEKGTTTNELPQYNQGIFSKQVKLPKAQARSVR